MNIKFQVQTGGFCSVDFPTWWLGWTCNWLIHVGGHCSFIDCNLQGNKLLNWALLDLQWLEMSVGYSLSLFVGLSVNLHRSVLCVTLCACPLLLYHGLGAATQERFCFFICLSVSPFPALSGLKSALSALLNPPTYNPSHTFKPPSQIFVLFGALPNFHSTLTGLKSAFRGLISTLWGPFKSWMRHVQHCISFSGLISCLRALPG